MEEKKNRIKEEFRNYLSNCVQTRRQVGKDFIIGRTTVDSYVSYAEIDKLFDYAPQKWEQLSSIYNITSSNKIYEIIETLSADDDFKKKDAEGTSQYFRSNAIKQYYCFLKAREIFKDSLIDTIPYNRLGLPLQQIFYGAPGTGKSHTIKEVTENQPKENVFRTTFHPDSDYSTFVGCYKPTKVKTIKRHRLNLSIEDLARELDNYYSSDESGKISGIQKFCFEYYPYIDGKYMSVNVKKLLELAGVPKDYNVEINKYIKFCHLFPEQDPGKITYEFIPQSFTKAYIRAWQTEDPVYLIIEEINRGNCAQIFGDLFQLLDRGNNGCSEYSIKADNDLATFIAEQLSSSERIDIPERVKNGDELVLPSNLYIWATMNTSDQSLFPIDSAFKRRWDWKYVPIDINKENWTIKTATKEYSWSLFLQKINDEIDDTTHSEDKMLGFYFCKADDGVISSEKFVGKVLFYVYNDVFKDYGFSREMFKGDDGKIISFHSYYNSDGSIDENKVEKFLDNLIQDEKSTIPSEENIEQ